MNRLVRSSKFWAAVLGGAIFTLYALGADQEVTPEQVQGLIALLVGLVAGGTALEDAAEKLGELFKKEK